MSRGQNSKYYSKISQELFHILAEYNNHNKYYFGESEYYLNSGSEFYVYDFVDLTSKKIIEFNGDYWHANPEKYLSESIIRLHGNKTVYAGDIWELDRKKHNFAILHGFTILVIWESDYNKNKSEVVAKCQTFLKKK